LFPVRDFDKGFSKVIVKVKELLKEVRGMLEELGSDVEKIVCIVKSKIVKPLDILHKEYGVGYNISMKV